MIGMTIGTIVAINGDLASVALSCAALVARSERGLPRVLMPPSRLWTGIVERDRGLLRVGDYAAEAEEWAFIQLTPTRREFIDSIRDPDNAARHLDETIRKMSDEYASTFGTLITLPGDTVEEKVDKLDHEVKWRRSLLGVQLVACDAVRAGRPRSDVVDILADVLPRELAERLSDPMTNDVGAIVSDYVNRTNSDVREMPIAGIEAIAWGDAKLPLHARFTLDVELELDQATGNDLDRAAGLLGVDRD